MALKSNFNESESMKDVLRQQEMLYQKIINAFIYDAETFIVNAREQGQSHDAGQYEDVTANLRNSVGYHLYHNGELVIEKEPGSYVGKETEGQLSQSEIKAINVEAIKGFVKSTGFQLILIAGMNYASYVESKGYNVISYQADICFVDISSHLEKLEVIEKGSAARLEESFVPDELPQNLTNG